MAVGAQRTRWASITTAAANVASTPVSVNACTPKYSNDPKCPGRLGTRVPRVLKAKARKDLAISPAAPPRLHHAQRKTMLSRTQQISEKTIKKTSRPGTHLSHGDRCRMRRLQQSGRRCGHEPKCRSLRNIGEQDGCKHDDEIGRE